MSWSIRRGFVVLLTLPVIASAACLEQARAQLRTGAVKQVAATTQQVLPTLSPNSASDSEVDPDSFLYGGIILPKDEHGYRRAIEAAVDYVGAALNDGKWAKPITRLQALLEIKEDVFVRLTRKNTDGKEVFAWVNVKREADRLIGTLPPAGLDFYKLTFGAKAADLLKKAKQKGDPGLLAEIMKRYAHTDAGGEAIKTVADYHLDRGNYLAAILSYDKLLNREGADKLSPAVLFKAAYAAHMASAAATPNAPITANQINEKELWRQLHNQTREVRLGNETYLVSDLEEYVAKLERPHFSQVATDSTVFRVTPDRGNQRVGGPAFMTPTWRKDLLYYKENQAPEVYQRLQQTEGLLTGRNRPILPAFSPITVTLTKGDHKEPLLIYKTYRGITARKLRDGKLAWEAPSQWSLECMLHSRAEIRKSQAINDWLQFYLDQGRWPEALLENSTVDTLSTDGKYVYVVEDLAVPPPPMNTILVNAGTENSGYGTEIQNAINHSRLQAFDLTNGKLSWELGGEEKGPLSNCYFLGPPLPLGGKLYVLIDKQHVLRLVCLDPHAKGAVVSTQTLGTAEEKMRNDVLRRTRATHLAYSEGILVCPTNIGAVFGINLLENSLLWAYPYRQKRDTTPQELRTDPFRGGLLPGVPTSLDGHLTQASPSSNSWKASAPVIADGKVIFTAPDARSLHCINLRDGSPVWRQPKQEDDLYLGNVHHGKVLIVGKKNVRGLSLSTGETLWTIETGLPSGQGIGNGSLYYLPLHEGGRGKEPRICVIDMDQGKIVSSRPSRPWTMGGTDFDVPGNLLFYEGAVISLTHREVVVYPQLKVP